jgi:hypothetical protein
MFEQGEILLIPVPFSNLSSVKKRPVLVLSNNAHNSSSRDIIVIAITDYCHGYALDTGKIFDQIFYHEPTRTKERLQTASSCGSR